MSQAKVDKHKQEKYNRKNAPKKSHIKKYLSYACATLVAALFIVYLGYSVGVETGLIKEKETTSRYISAVSSEELASTLATSGDQLGFYSKYAGAAATDSEEAEATESATEAETAE